MRRGSEEGEGRPSKRTRTDFVPYTPRGPVQTPHQAPPDDASSVRLDFNFWMGQGCISPADLTSLILKVLSEPTRDVPFLQENELNGVTGLHLFLLHGVNGEELDDHMSRLKFLRSCTSVPIRHSTTPWSVPTFRDDRSSQRMWRYNEVEDMTSLILWPEKSHLSLSEVEGKDTLSVFAEFSLLLRILRGSWSDTLLFTADPASEESFNQLVKVSASDASPGVGGVFGRFQHQSSYSSGDTSVSCLSH